jgi:hypothetical protein
VGNQHLLAHAHVLDTCVDRAILSFLEGFNQNVAPTFSSCQSVDMLPGRPGRGVQEPFIVAHGPHQPCRCRKLHLCWLGGVVVLVEDAAESIMSSDDEVI